MVQIVGFLDFFLKDVNYITNIKGFLGLFEG